MDTKPSPKGETGRNTSHAAILWLSVLLIANIILSLFIVGFLLGRSSATPSFMPTADLLSQLYILELEKYPVESSEDALRMRFLRFFNINRNGIIADYSASFRPLGKRPGELPDKFSSEAKGDNLVPRLPPSTIIAFPEDLEVVHLEEERAAVAFSESFLRLLPVRHRSWILEGSPVSYWHEARGEWYLDIGYSSDDENHPRIRQIVETHEQMEEEIKGIRRSFDEVG